MARGDPLPAPARRRGRPVPRAAAAGALLLAAVFLAGGCSAPKRVLRPPAGPPEIGAPPRPTEPPPGATPPAEVAPGTAGPAAAPAAADPGAAAAALASRQVGAPYRYGGGAPGGFDCSGLAWYAYREQGIALPRTVRRQAGHGRPVPRDQLRPGDLLFFSVDADGRADHVGIFLGHNQFVHAPGRGRTVERQELDGWWRRHWLGTRRPWSEAANRKD